jgi:hypothetical protein
MSTWNQKVIDQMMESDNSDQTNNFFKERVDNKLDMLLNWKRFNFLSDRQEAN